MLEKFASGQKYLPLNALADKKNQITIPTAVEYVNKQHKKQMGQNICGKFYTFYYL